MDINLEDIEFQWIIGGVTTIRDLSGLKDVVFTVDLTLSGVYKAPDNMTYCEGFQFPTGLIDENNPPNFDSFTEFKFISQEQMLSWVLSKLTETQINDAKLEIKRRLEKQSTYRTSAPPWVAAHTEIIIPPGEEIVFDIPPKP